MRRLWFVGLALLVGVGFGTIVQHFWTNQPRPISVHLIGVKPTALRGGYDIAVGLDVPPTPDCLRLSEHLLYRGIDPREVVVLATSFTGLNFISQRPLVEMTLHVPGYVAGGPWYYVNRSVYLCVQFGLMTRVSRFESAPVPFELPHE